MEKTGANLSQGLLADELQLRWMRHCTPGELAKLECVSREWQRLVRDFSLWRGHCQRISPRLALRKPETIPWRDFYRTEVRIWKQRIGLLQGGRRISSVHRIDGRHRPVRIEVDGRIRLVVVDNEGRIVCYSPFKRDGAVVQKSVQGHPVTHLTTFRRGSASLLAVALRGWGVVVIDLARPQGPRLNFWYTASISSLRVHRDRVGAYWLLAASGSEIRAWQIPPEWDVHCTKACRTLHCEHSVSLIHCTPFDESFLVAGAGRISLCSLRGARPSDIVAYAEPRAFQHVIVRQQLHLFFGDADAVYRWNLSKGSREMPYQGYQPNPVTAWVAADDGASGRLYVGSEDGSIQLWKIEPPMKMGTTGAHGTPVTALERLVLGRETYVVSASSDGVIKAWDAISGRLKGSFVASGPVSHLISIPTKEGPVYLGVVIDGKRLEIWDFEPAAPFA